MSIHCIYFGCKGCVSDTALAQGRGGVFDFGNRGGSTNILAGLTGFEPATSRVTGERSKPLSYNPMSALSCEKCHMPSAYERRGVYCLP